MIMNEKWILEILNCEDNPLHFEKFCAAFIMEIQGWSAPHRLDINPPVLG
jgi:hypothetical protein